MTKRNPIPTEQRKKTKPKVEKGFDKWQQSYTYSETFNSNGVETFGNIIIVSNSVQFPK
jgi:hypothetical protein